MELYSTSLFDLNGLTSFQNDGVRTEHSRLIFLSHITSRQEDLIIPLLQMKLIDITNVVGDIYFEKNNNKNLKQFQFTRDIKNFAICH